MQASFAVAEPALHPEDAMVFIEVQIEKADVASGQMHKEKVAEGSGFLISNSGWLLTAAHLVNIEVPPGATLLLQGSVRSRFQHKFPLERPPQTSVGADVVLLRFPPGVGEIFPYLCALKQPNIGIGQELAAIGYPLGFDFSIRPGKVTSLSGPQGLIQTNLGLARGMSGGPILDNNKAVLGVTAGGFDGQNSFDFFIPMNLAQPLLDIPPTTGDSKCPDGREIKTPPTFERSYQIDETNDDHTGIDSNTKSYSVVKKADPDTVIVDARIVRQSDTRVSDLNIAPDRRSVELRFKLTAGPVFDRWRGWLHGQLILTLLASP